MLDLLLTLANVVPLLVALVVLSRFSRERPVRFWVAFLITTAAIAVAETGLLSAYSGAPLVEILRPVAVVVVMPVAGAFVAARFFAGRSGSRGHVEATVAYFVLLLIGFYVSLSFGLVR